MKRSDSRDSGTRRQQPDPVRNEGGVLQSAVTGQSTNPNPVNLRLENGPPSVSSKIKEYKSNLLGDNKFTSQKQAAVKENIASRGADPINDKLEKLTGLL